MVWAIEFDEAAKKELAKLEPQIATRLLDFLTQRVISLKDPRSFGQALKGSKLGEFWKYRVGDFRIIAKIQDQKMIILVLRIGNRREIYR